MHLPDAGIQVVPSRRGIRTQAHIHGYAIIHTYIHTLTAAGYTRRTYIIRAYAAAGHTMHWIAQLNSTESGPPDEPVKGISGSTKPQSLPMKQRGDTGILQ